MRETNDLEFKESITKTFLKTVSAFANYGTGRIVFGVDDSGAIHHENVSQDSERVCQLRYGANCVRSGRFGCHDRPFRPYSGCVANREHDQRFARPRSAFFTRHRRKRPNGFAD